GVRDADRGWQVVAQAGTAGAAEVVIVLVHGPEPARPSAHAARHGVERPVEPLDLRPDLGADPRGRDRTRVPGQRGRLLVALARLLVRLLIGFAPLLVGRLAIVRDRRPDRLDQRRERGL